MALITLFPTNDSKWLYLNRVTSSCTDARLPLHGCYCCCCCCCLWNCGCSNSSCTQPTTVIIIIIIFRCSTGVPWPSYLFFQWKANLSALLLCQTFDMFANNFNCSLHPCQFPLIGRQCVCLCVWGSGGAIQYWRAIWWVLAGWKEWKVVCVGWDRCCSLKWRNAVSEGRLSQLICQTRTGDQTSERKKRGKLMEKTQSPFFSFAFLRWRALFHFWAMAIIGATIAIICSSSEQAHSCSATY